jgi:hypothetical protein
MAQAAPCTEVYTIDSLLADMVAVEGSVRTGDNAQAGATAAKLEAGLACTDEILPGMILGRAMRGIGAGLTVAGETDRGTRWFRSALNLEGNFEYGLQDLPAEHVVRDVYGDVRQDLEEGTSSTVSKPLREGTTVVVNGRKVSTASVDTKAMYLVQVDGDAFQSYVVEGDAFPEAALPMAVATKTAKTKKSKGKSSKPAKDSARIAKAGAAAGAAVAAGGKKAPTTKVAKAEPAPKKSKTQEATATEKVASADKPRKQDKPAKEPKTETVATKVEKAKPEPRERVAKSAKKSKAADRGEERVAQAEPEPAPAKRSKPSGPTKQDAPPATNGPQIVTNSVIMGPQVIQRQRPKEKTPLLVGGGLVLAGGGALYALSFQGKADLADRARAQASGDLFTSEADIDAKISNVNALYMSAVACIAVGSGSLTWGIMVDSGVTMPRFGLRF